jgi:hypothetical protein
MNAKIRYCGMGAALAGLLAACAAMSGDAPRVAADQLGGVVTSAQGREAGVWVIAETRDLPTPFAKIVVTDARGRYLIPDLPQA